MDNYKPGAHSTVFTCLATLAYATNTINQILPSLQYIKIVYKIKDNVLLFQDTMDDFQNSREIEFIPGSPKTLFLTTPTISIHPQQDWE